MQELLKRGVKLFQFQYGAIKRVSEGKKQDKNGKFQFQYGAIKRYVPENNVNGNL